MRLRASFVLIAVLGLAGCAAPSVYAPDEAIAAVSYSDPSPPSLTLYTMVNNRTGAGGHSSLIINASEQVLFDPAGTFRMTTVPERNDVLFGITPAVKRAYASSHARATHHVVIQEIPVTAEQAELAYRLALQSGPVPGAYCASATSGLLRQIPGLGSLPQTFYPVTLSDAFGQLPGVRTQKLFEDDDVTIDEAVAALN